MGQRTCSRCGKRILSTNKLGLCQTIETGCSAERQRLERYAKTGKQPTEYWRPAAPCDVCQTPTQSYLGVCKLNPECNAEYLRRKRHGLDAQKKFCAKCGLFIRADNECGICDRPACAAERQAVWHEAHPGKKATYDLSCRAKRKAATFVEDIDPAILITVLGNTCALCGHPLSGKLHLDHIVPLARGGEHSYANTHMTHAGCNVRKHARPWADPYASIRPMLADRCRALAAAA